MDWMNVVGKVAPWLGAAITGPMGGAAIGAIANALGLSEATEDAVKSALSGTTPEQMLALKKADYEFSLKMKELGFADSQAMEALAVSDRDSARKREIAVGDKTTRNLAYATTAGFFGILIMLIFVDVPVSSKEVLYVMLGSLGTAWIGVNAYYFGNNKHNQTNTELLAKAQPVKD